MNELTDRDESGLGWVYPPQPQQTFIEEVIGMISGVIELVEDQDYIDVVFGSAQPTADWMMIEASIFNTTDGTPINVWPGVVTSKTTTGFRLQLNGTPDSGNYFLTWSIRGVFGYYLSGPSSCRRNVASAPFTVRLPDESTLTGTVIITPSDGGVGGTFTPATVALTIAAPSATFTYTPSSYGPRSIGTDNDRGLIDPAEIGFTSIASEYTLDGPSSGDIGTPSTDFTVALPVGGSVLGTVTITPDDGGVGGTFTPTTIDLTTAVPSATFTYTPVTAGDITISTTNNGGLNDPASLIYTSNVILPNDTFTDTNGVTLPAHTMDAGTGWTRFRGAGTDHITIQSNKASSFLDVGNAYAYSTESGVADCTIECTGTLGSFDTGHFAYIAFRCTDTNNFWQMKMTGPTPDNIQLIKVEAGVETTVDSGSLSITPGADVLISVTLSGTSITGSVGSVNLSTTSAFNQTATKHGIGLYHGFGSSNTMDNFAVTL